MYWTATAIDGTEFDSDTCETYERVNERGGARALRVVNATGEHVAHCVPERGESLHLFTRRAIVGVGRDDARQVDCPVIELRRGSEMSARLYLHPEICAVLSTEDLNL